jgi:hypothetical protein
MNDSRGLMFRAARGDNASYLFKFDARAYVFDDDRANFPYLGGRT